MSREGKLVKNTMILGLGSFFPRLTAFITLPILTGYLTKAEYGTYDLITVLVSLILPAATLQIQSAAFRFLIDERGNEERKKSIISNIFAFIVPTSLLVLCVLYLFLPGDMTIRILICAYFFADILVNASRQVARGLHMNLRYSISAIISATGKMVFAVIFVLYMKMGLMGAVLALMLSDLLSFIYMAAALNLPHYIDLRLVNKKDLKALLSYSWPIVPNSLSMWVMRVSDRFVINVFMGAPAVAVYAVANKIPSLLTLAQSTFTMAWYESASIVSKEDDATEYYSSMYRTIYDLMAGILGLLISFMPILFKLLIRGDYSESYTQMPILFLAMFFYSLCAFLGGIYVAFKDTKSVGITTTCAAVCNLVVDLATIRWIGLYAASISTLVSYLFLYLFRMYDVRKFVKITYDYVHMAIVLVIMFVELFLCFLQNRVLNIANMALGVIAFVVLNREVSKALAAKTLQTLKKFTGR